MVAKRHNDSDSPYDSDEHRTGMYENTAQQQPQSANQRSVERTAGLADSARQKGSSPGKSFAVFDIDGTLIRWQLYHAVADSLVKLGYIDAQSYRQIKDARMSWKRRESNEAFSQYELRLVQLFTNVMMSISVQQFQEAAEAVFSEYKDQVYVYTRELIKKLKKDGYLIFAISGSQEEVIKKMAGYYGFDDVTGRVDEVAGGRFTGKSTTPVFAKDRALADMIAKHGATLKDSFGIGDSHSDIKMLEMVARPIAFNPERRLFDYATKRGWKIAIERKNMVYELEFKADRYELI